MPSTVGSMAMALEAATETLAGCEAFQERVGAADADAAREHIGWDTLEDNEGLAIRRPFAIIKITARGANQVADGIAIDLVAGGAVLIYLCDNADGNLTHAENYLDFLGFVGAVIDQMEAVSGYGDELPFHDAEMILPAMRTPRGERTPNNAYAPANDYWEAAFLLRYGDLD